MRKTWPPTTALAPLVVFAVLVGCEEIPTEPRIGDEPIALHLRPVDWATRMPHDSAMRPEIAHDTSLCVFLELHVSDTPSRS